MYVAKVKRMDPNRTLHSANSLSASTIIIMMVIVEEEQNNTIPIILRRVKCIVDKETCDRNM